MIYQLVLLLTTCDLVSIVWPELTLPELRTRYKVVQW